jgi:hypothetical protein
MIQLRFASPTLWVVTASHDECPTATATTAERRTATEPPPDTLRGVNPDDLWST